MKHNVGKGRKSGRILEAVILIALPILAHYLIPIMIVIPKPYSYVGLVLMIIGLALNTWAAMEFRREGTGFQLQGGMSTLVTTGPFRYGRNPMYLGMLLWLLGLAILLGSIVAFIFPVVVFFLANFWIIPMEERRMVLTMGEAYLEYKKRVRRWF